MPERVTPLLPVTVEYVCDRCGAAVQPSPIPDIGRDGLTLHQCPDCQSIYRLDGVFPRQQYVDFMAWLRDCQEIINNDR